MTPPPPLPSLSNKLRHVSLNDLLLVLNVAREKNFRQVARDMHISPSGLSHQVRKVEMALETTLFERGAKQVCCTPAGEQLIAHIAQVLDLAKDLEVISQAKRLPFGGKLRIAASRTIGPYLLPALCAALPDWYPGVAINVYEQPCGADTRGLGLSDIDLLISCRPSPHSDVTTIELYQESFFAFAGEQHALARQSAISLAELTACENAFIGDGYSCQQALKNNCSIPSTERADAARQPSSCYRGSLETIACSVALTNGITLIPRLAVERLASIPHSRIIPITPNVHRTVNASWRSSNLYADDITALCARIRQWHEQIEQRAWPQRLQPV